jgi:hypothetical protein
MLCKPTQFQDVIDKNCTLSKKKESMETHEHMNILSVNTSYF